MADQLVKRQGPGGRPQDGGGTGNGGSSSSIIVAIVSCHHCLNEQF